MKKFKVLIIKITFPDRVMLFGNSYKPWYMQVDEYMHRCAEDLQEPVKAEYSRSKWIGWGGLKWCPEDRFQYQLNREGCQDGEPDNPYPRGYSQMHFEEVDKKAFTQIFEYYVQGQRLLKINNLSKEDYRRYQLGELKITV